MIYVILASILNAGVVSGLFVFLTNVAVIAGSNRILPKRILNHLFLTYLITYLLGLRVSAPTSNLRAPMTADCLAQWLVV